MGYLHIENLYRPHAQTILLFKECYALEKIHGTSAHITYHVPVTPSEQGRIIFFSGGETHSRFVSLFNEPELFKLFQSLSLDKNITVYGEAYGGKQQGMSDTYGKELKFIAFDVLIGDTWLKVPDAEAIVKGLGLEFVHYVKVSTDLKELDAQRDAFSVQAVRNGVTTSEEFMSGKGKHREGVVLRPLMEMTLNNGSRIIVKHKGAAFSETATPRQVEVDPAKQKLLEDATAIANEWVTNNRLLNAITHFQPEELDMKNFPNLLKYLVEDVIREGAGEVPDTKEVRQALTRKSAELWKGYLTKVRV